MIKEEIASYDNLWAGFIGLVIGFVVAKVYQIWAILFIEYGRSLMHEPITGWNSKPLWVLATEYPSMFVFIVSLIFMTFAIVFMRFLKSRTALL